MANYIVTPTLAILLETTVTQGASDLHIVADSPPIIRIDGSLRTIDQPAFSAEQVNAEMAAFIGDECYQRIQKTTAELDFSFDYSNDRFRCNIFMQRGSLAASFRFIPQQVRGIDDLGLPPVVTKMLEHNQGLLLVTGPTGHGKTTTLAAMVDYISALRRWHILTIEDPIEHIFEHRKSIISQREVGQDTSSFPQALKMALREDPDMVVIGEMRDLETVEAAMQIAETGHLVISTLHTNSVSQTANRIISMFPPSQQAQVRAQFADVLLGITSQRLLPRIKGGRILANEVLVANAAVRSIIREGKTHQLPNLVQTSAAEGMINLDRSLADLVIRGEVAIDDALAWASDQKALKLMVY